MEGVSYARLIGAICMQRAKNMDGHTQSSSIDRTNHLSLDILSLVL